MTQQCEGVTIPETQQHNKGNTMFINLNKTEKALIDSLVSKGHSLYVDGRGWWFDDRCFWSGRDFMRFCREYEQ